MTKNELKQAGAELSQAQVKLKVIAGVSIEVGVEVVVKCHFPAGGCLCVWNEIQNPTLKAAFCLTYV